MMLINLSHSAFSVRSLVLFLDTESSCTTTTRIVVVFQYFGLIVIISSYKPVSVLRVFNLSMNRTLSARLLERELASRM